ncbi:MAG: hypothetical protein KatS3mg110_1620 [Pirellulaceae bacterium]|nr:MAG: hypothetical protein KatS3mg110_1620 [Pirellulaceae bacterium]
MYHKVMGVPYVIVTWVLGCVVLLVLPVQLAAQGRAGSGSRGVYRDRVDPHWVAEGEQFWYANRLPGNRVEYVLVDAEHGRRGPLFDPEKLADALQTATGTAVNPERFSPTDLDVSQDARYVYFRFAGKPWRWDRTSQTLEQVDRPANAEPTTNRVPDRTEFTGEEIELLIANRTARTIELFWVDMQGQERSYGRIEPGEEKRQHTYEGHVWRARDISGRLVSAFVAARERSQVEIRPGENRPLDPPRRPAGRGAFRGSSRSPDGRWEAFIQDANLWIRRIGSSEERQLSSDGKAEDAFRPPFYWSPDSQYLAVIQETQVPKRKIYFVESSPADQLQPRLHEREYVKPGDPLPRPRPRIFHVPSGRAIAIDESLIENPWHIERFRWSPDSKRFSFLYNQRGHHVLRLISVDVESGENIVVIEEKSNTFVDYAHKLYLRWLDDTNEIIWMSERSGWNHLYLFDALTGQMKNPITTGPWVVRSVERIDEAKRELLIRVMGYYEGQDPYHMHYARVNFDGSQFTMLTEDDGTHSLQFSPNGKYYLDTWSRVDRPPVTQLRRYADGGLVCHLEEADISELFARGFRMPERFVAKGRDGQTDIWGVIYRPTRMEPGKRYPILEDIYAGPQGFFVPKAFQASSRSQTLADEGYIVVKIDGMGTNWRSKAFHDVCWKNLADAGFPDRILWIRAAAERYPEMDLTRIGIFGTSAGGQSAMRALIDHGDFYKAAVADCGCHDNRMDKIWWNELWMGWPIGPHYEACSNVVHAHRMQGKLLLAVGEMDTNVDPASTMQVVNALIKANKDFELLIVPGAGHGVMRSGYGWRRLLDFFRRNLQQDAPVSAAENRPVESSAR